MPNLHYRHARPGDAERCYQIERLAYAGDEAATLAKIQQRIDTYPEGFLVLELDQQIVGFVNAGATHHVALSDESFKELVGHDATGPYIVIMSVVVHPDFQRNGFAGALLTRFIEHMKALGKSGIYLICQPELVSFYARFGFIDLGDSDSDHGGLAWREMVLMM